MIAFEVLVFFILYIGCVNIIECVFWCDCTARFHFRRVVLQRVGVRERAGGRHACHCSPGAEMLIGHIPATRLREEFIERTMWTLIVLSDRSGRADVHGATDVHSCWRRFQSNTGLAPRYR